MTYESVLHLIDRRVKHTPDQLAISRGNERINYRELQDRTDQLAHLLLSGGAKKDSIIAILLDNRVDAIISILAVLKAGAVFVPIHRFQICDWKQ
jgi:acyl-CoA synthetase (AMP-forming)/AMP-acid ligase II